MKGQMLAKMLLIATLRHAGQFDKGGRPYILHPLKVMHYLKTDDEELQCIALGHDLIEDTFGDVMAGLLFLVDEGFSERVICGIYNMTKIPGESYEDYKERVMGSEDATLVKMADLRHNSDIRRLKGIGVKDVERLKRYSEFYMELEANQ
jgi:(p)ppGpp synthase/HD superfamily hydrolase